MVAARHALVPAPSTMSLILVVKLSVQEKCVYRRYVLAKLSTRKVSAIYGLCLRAEARLFISGKV